MLVYFGGQGPERSVLITVTATDMSTILILDDAQGDPVPDTLRTASNLVQQACFGLALQDFQVRASRNA